MIKLNQVLGYQQIGRKICIGFWPDETLAIELLKISPSELGLDLAGRGEKWLMQFDIHRRTELGRDLGFQEELIQRPCKGEPAIFPETLHTLDEIFRDVRCWHTKEELTEKENGKFKLEKP